jgi:hypothetical protein
VQRVRQRPIAAAILLNDVVEVIDLQRRGGGGEDEVVDARTGECPQVAKCSSETALLRAPTLFGDVVVSATTKSRSEKLSISDRSGETFSQAVAISKQGEMVRTIAFLRRWTLGEVGS